MSEITAEQYEAATGHPPQDDDLERSNCPDAGSLMHQVCGWDHERNLPEFIAVAHRLKENLDACHMSLADKIWEAIQRPSPAVSYAEIVAIVDEWTAADCVRDMYKAMLPVAFEEMKTCDKMYIIGSDVVAIDGLTGKEMKVREVAPRDEDAALVRFLAGEPVRDPGFTRDTLGDEAIVADAYAQNVFAAMSELRKPK